MIDLVSVIIPAYNCEKTIERAIKSCQANVHKNIEIIVVNDGSTDKTDDVVKSIMCDKIRYFRNSNHGVSYSRNFGLEHSEGNYVMFLDSDDELVENAIDKLVTAMKTTNLGGVDMVVGQMLICNGNTDSRDNFPEIPNLLRENEYFELILRDHPIGYYAVRTLFKKSFINDVKFEVGKCRSEDSDFCFSCSLKKPKVLIIDEYIYKYHMINTSLSHKPINKNEIDDILFFLSKKRKIVQQINDPMYTRLFEHLELKQHIMLLRNYILLPQKQYDVMEKEIKNSLSYFKNNKSHYLDEPKSKFYKILALNLYKPYRFFLKVRRIIGEQ